MSNPSEIASLQLSPFNELTVTTSEGTVTLALSRTAAQILAAGLQRGVGISDSKSGHLAFFSKYIDCKRVIEPMRRGGRKSIRLSRQGVYKLD